MLSKKVFELDPSVKNHQDQLRDHKSLFLHQRNGANTLFVEQKGNAIRKGQHLVLLFSKCFLPLLSPFVKPERLSWPHRLLGLSRPFPWLPGRWSMGMGADRAVPQPGPGQERAELFFLLKSLHSYGLRLSLTLSSFLQALPLWCIHICLAAFHTFCVLHQKVQTVSNELVLEFTRLRRA